MCQLCETGPFAAFSATAVHRDEEYPDGPEAGDFVRRANAHAVVARELEGWRDLTADELRSQVGETPVARTVELDGESMLIEVCVAWADASQERVRVEAIAYGPSTWRMDPVAEHILLQLPPFDARTEA
jgi:hypothetical protein